MPGEWGGGWDGSGKRYASTFGTSTARQLCAFGLDNALHEDPRYFPSTRKGFGPRVANVLKQTFFTTKDNGQATFAYSRVGSPLGAGFLANSWVFRRRP